MTKAFNPSIDNTLKVTGIGGVLGLSLSLYKQLVNPFLTTQTMKMNLRYTLKYSGLGLVFMATQQLVQQVSTSDSLRVGAGLFASGLYLGVRKGQLGYGVTLGTTMGLFGLVSGVLLSKDWKDATKQQLIKDPFKNGHLVRQKYKHAE